jgi:hypothetical protein
MAFLIAFTPFALNAVMGIVKWMGAKDMTTPGKRFLLAIFALVGVVAGNSLLGTPVQPDSITSILSILFESLAAFIAAHGSYTLFWNKS